MYKKIIIGSSAGAMVQIKDYHITPDEDYGTFTYNKGLNLIKNFGVEVHYEATNLQNYFIKKVLSEKKDIIYALKDNGGIIVENDSIKLLGEVIVFRGS